MPPALATCCLLVLCTHLALAQTRSPTETPTPTERPLTRAERSDYHETSTNADVETFLHALTDLPSGAAIALHEFGRTTLGRPLRLVIASHDAATLGPRALGEGSTGRLRALILANIHGGEVEGKEVAQILLREIAAGEHRDLLDAFDLAFVPVFNADGNDAIDVANRKDQNGPKRGVGLRHNASDRDLNRDYVKLETPEVRAQLALLRAFDPHLYMDLHTTNGSEHGYQLTYAPALSTNLDPELDAFAHAEFMPRIREAMLERHGFHVFDYGNFPSGGRGENGARGWYTFDHKPRVGWNYVGLRNRLSVLSEAYSYADFRTRIAVTRAFVLENLRALHASAERARGIFARADARVTQPDTPRPLLGFDSDFARPALHDLRLQDGELAAEMPVFVRFESRRAIVYPDAWAIESPPPLVVHTLLLHGLEVEQTTAPIEVNAEAFWPTSLSRPRLTFQGHQLITMSGQLTETRRTLPVGTVIIRSRQRLARVAAVLLDPHSEDSLATWSFFGDRVRRVDAASVPSAGDDVELAFPVLRLHPSTTELPTTPCRFDTFAMPHPNLLPRVDDDAESPRTIVRLICTEPGERLATDFESAPSWRSRKLTFEVNGKACADMTELRSALAELVRTLPTESMVLLQPDPLVHVSEVESVAASAREAGITRLALGLAKQE